MISALCHMPSAHLWLQPVAIMAVSYLQGPPQVFVSLLQGFPPTPQKCIQSSQAHYKSMCGGGGRLSSSREPPTHVAEPCINVLGTDNFQRFQWSWAIFPKAVTSITYLLLVCPLFLSNYTCSFTPIPFNNLNKHPAPRSCCTTICTRSCNTRLYWGGEVVWPNIRLSCPIILYCL